LNIPLLSFDLEGRQEIEKSLHQAKHNKSHDKVHQSNEESNSPSEKREIICLCFVFHENDRINNQERSSLP
jgi:hypothetical protein